MSKTTEYRCSWSRRCSSHRRGCLCKCCTNKGRVSSHCSCCVSESWKSRNTTWCKCWCRVQWLHPWNGWSLRILQLSLFLQMHPHLEASFLDDNLRGHVLRVQWWTENDNIIRMRERRFWILSPREIAYTAIVYDWSKCSGYSDRRENNSRCALHFSRVE
jgi:hypothetical protein